MSQETVEVAGGFADLGLEDPNVALPTRGFPLGTYKGFISNARFVAHKTDANKKNLELTYKCNEPGNKQFDKEVSERKPANANDDVKVKGYLKERLIQVGVQPEDMARLNVKSLIGTPVYFTIVQQRDKNGNSTEFTQIGRVSLDTDSDHVDYTPPNSDPTGVSAPAAVSAADITY